LPVGRVPPTDTEDVVQQGPTLCVVLHAKSANLLAQAFAQAVSELQSLDGEIENQCRMIAPLNSGVDVAKSVAMSSESGRNRASASVDEAKAVVSNAKAAVEKADGN
jgi:hypothetical protein